MAWTFSAAAHLFVFAALFWPHAPSPLPPDAPSPIQVTVVEVPKPDPPGPPDAAPAKAGGAPRATSTPTHHSVAAPSPIAAATAGPEIVAAAVAAPAPDMSDVLNETQLAGAADAQGESAGGGGGGDCNTARIVQQALRRDPLVHTAVEDAHRLGKAVMLWNGDWVRSGEQEGKGLSAVREAIIWELAFAPKACREKQVHGLVVLSLSDGSTRFAIGAGDWRWSDLLNLSPADR